MRDTIFPRWQGAFLAIFLLADGLYLPAAPQAVHNLLLGGLLALLVSMLWLKILSNAQQRDFESLCQNHLFAWACRLLFALVAAACIAGIWYSLERLSAFWKQTAFMGFPRWFGALILLFLGWRAGRRGRTAVSMWAYPMLFFTGAVILLSLLVTVPDCAPEHLPALFEGFTIMPSLLCRYLWLLLPLILCTQDKETPNLRAYSIGVLSGSLGLVLIALRAWLVLGAGASQLPYPAFSAAGVFSVGDFLQRGEVIFGCALALCEAVRVALLITLLYSACRIVFPKQNAKQQKPCQT